MLVALVLDSVFDYKGVGGILTLYERATAPTDCVVGSGAVMMLRQ